MGYSGLQQTAAGYDGSQQITMGYSGLHWVTAGYDGLQQVTMGYSRLRWVTEGYNGLQQVTVGLIYQVARHPRDYTTTATATGKYSFS